MLKPTAFYFFILCIIGCGQARHKTVTEQEPADIRPMSTEESVIISSDTINQPIKKQMNKYYPFEIQEIGGDYTIIANIESENLYPRYYEFFQQLGYEGNGYCWEGHITQLLEKLDSKLLDHIEFDSEAGAFYANADSKETQLKFVEILSPVFSDINKLEDWVKKADRSRIDD